LVERVSNTDKQSTVIGKAIESTTSNNSISTSESIYDRINQAKQSALVERVSNTDKQSTVIGKAIESTTSNNSISTSESIYDRINQAKQSALVERVSTGATALATKQAQQQASASVQPNVSNTYTITISQQPGQDPQALAQAVMAEINRQQAVKSRSGMYDR
jgi:hypothetical protein